jgi:hypothetical protein
MNEQGERKKIEFKVEEFTDGENEIVIQVSTSKTATPRVTVSIGRKPKFTGDPPSRYLPFEQIPEIIKVLEAIQASHFADHAKVMAAIREKALAKFKNQNAGGGSYNQDKRAKRAARRQFVSSPVDHSQSEKHRKENAKVAEMIRDRGATQ